MGKKGQADRRNKPTITWVWNSTRKKDYGKGNQNNSEWISLLEKNKFRKFKANVCRINISFSAQAVEVGNISSNRTVYYLDA
jgi:hypothetical protein